MQCWAQTAPQGLLDHIFLGAICEPPSTFGEATPFGERGMLPSHPPGRWGLLLGHYYALCPIIGGPSGLGGGSWQGSPLC